MKLIDLDPIEGLREVGDDIVDVLGTDRETDGRRLNAGIQQLFRTQLRMRGGSGVNDQGFHIRNVCQQREELQRFGELLRLLPRAIELKGEDRSAAIGIVLIV